ncbi:MAG: hypothetical protein LBD18_00375, partial [Treponema sp.]|nr:hypothetical protein [Treponema sp.]
NKTVRGIIPGLLNPLLLVIHTGIGLTGVPLPYLQGLVNHRVSAIPAYSGKYISCYSCSPYE